MATTWQGQVAVITGGASGIGFAVAEKLQALGARLALLDLSQERLEEARKRLGDKPFIHVTDVGDGASVEDAIQKTLQEFGRIDALLNSAGIAGKTGLKSHEVELDDFDKVCQVNLRGSFVVCKAVIPHMVTAGYGRICLMASIAGKEGNAGMAAYSASKAGVIGLTKTLGKDYAGTGVTVNALAPAVIHTPIHDTIPQAQIDYMTSRIPMGRCGTLDEVASMIAFIVSPENSFTTGFCFDLSGGRATY